MSQECHKKKSKFYSHDNNVDKVMCNASVAIENYVILQQKW